MKISKDLIALMLLLAAARGACESVCLTAIASVAFSRVSYCSSQSRSSVSRFSLFAPTASCSLSELMDVGEVAPILDRGQQFGFVSTCGQSVG
jgi:hypothetical protein